MKFDKVFAIGFLVGFCFVSMIFSEYLSNPIMFFIHMNTGLMATIFWGFIMGGFE